MTFISFGIAGFAQNGKLDKAKKDLKDEPVTTSSTTEVRENRRNIRKEKPLQNLFTAIALNLTYGVVVETIFERNTEMHYASIAPYPYKSDDYGNFMYADESNDGVLIRLDIANDFIYESKTLYGNDLNLKFRFAKRFDIELDYLQLIEDVSTGTDGFSMYSALVNYHRVRTQKLDFWFGLGTMYVANDVKEFGFAYTLGTEWFITKPISLTGTYKGTSINQHQVDKTTLQLKYYIENYAVTSGYKHYTIASEGINAFSLGFAVSF
jgi:opacity protein-like surface antigen